MKREAPRSLEMGLELEPNSNFALISTPGDYAASEALKALHLGLNVMIFSHNVSSEDEIGLKRYVRDNGLLVMGPDRGTDLQQVTCLVDRLGGASVRRSAQAAMILAARSAGLRCCKASRGWPQTRLQRSSS